MEIIPLIDKIITKTNDLEMEYPRIELPELFLEWQSVARLQSFDTMMKFGAQAVRTQPSHLPVMATLGNDPFPNLSTRGIGILPSDDNIQQFTQLLEETKIGTHEMPLEESLPIRVDAMRKFYSDINNFNRFMLGGLDIFGGTTSANLKESGMAALLYTGEAPRFPSYQINCLVQLIENDNPYYQFLLAARELFAMDAFHIHQIEYPFGYLLFPVELKDKTPYPKRQ